MNTQDQVARLIRAGWEAPDFTDGKFEFQGLDLEGKVWKLATLDPRAETFTVLDGKGVTVATFAELDEVLV